MSRIKREEELGESVFASVAPFFSWVYRVSLVACVVSLGYLLYALLIVKIGTDPGRITDFEAIVNNLKLVGAVCTLSTGIFALALTLVYYQVKDLVLYMGALGAAFWFGLPIGVGRLVISQGGAQNAATNAIVGSLVNAGKFVFVVAAIRGVIVGIDWIRQGPTLKKPTIGVAQKEKASVIRQRKMNAFSPCWQLPYCRDSIREKCPAFVAKKRCWKFGRGCYCDEDMIQAIVAGTGGVSSDPFTKSGASSVTKKKKRQGKPPCGKCYIYLEHQNLKHKLCSGFMVPAAIVLCAALWKPYTAVYDVAMEHGRQLWQRMSFGAHMAQQERPQVTSEDAWAADTRGAGSESLQKQEGATLQKFDLWQKVFVMAMVAVFILVYLSKALEFVIFRLHW